MAHAFVSFMCFSTQPQGAVGRKVENISVTVNITMQIKTFLFKKKWLLGDVEHFCTQGQK